MDVDGDAEPKGTDVSETGAPTDNVEQEDLEELKQDEVVEDDEANGDGTEEGRKRRQINDSANAF